MKITEMRQKSKEELETLLAERRQHLLALRSMAHERKVKNVREMSGVRKDVARTLTLLRGK
ncbi:MAG: 50S ribosomal protein L29 [Candidatus Sungbacteria bacterium RIFCSPLOWO2_02_FULL_54_10]|uniref:Large ribosomal subunit protein uL29 n=2 Tax=Candidatus Sungiibacteriota TaxID=1817917 RepID=A0A1G2L968_9BACT|nr:MAG: 50S ribosomal protein L29 [Candidatus Sungbacteria bacterium RIFCSPHIGHO2_01_FULL_54_26]OHA02790.1 MAG: 50S ribosomal protein L29 [Candidatus Sungbacteria bacterium RIFCSPHIGHO2_02_FULL_53_17]OHA08185.1 MAG: 50S ribosomal protein L29 [Candidatus Sungbacteria bacterium RIFCSPLOWO2_01_FULL_54_21]OHA12618.1 MAG: 50S ribosomal protein L29 [Candidatus Sungbacteria bacterium RIFCSPLOWO2_02_FULL_54_10]